MSWRFHAFTLNGDGTETPLAWDIPLMGVSITDSLSGPGQLDATLKPELSAYQSRGASIFKPWSTAIYAEYGGDIRGGFIVADTSVDAETLTITCPGFRAYWTGLPHTGEFRGIKVDPLNVLRDHIIGHAQSQPGGNLGLTVDDTTSPVRIGTESKEVSFTTKSGDDVNFESGPHVLAWWNTDDLGKEWDDLAEETPFDYHIEHTWDGDRVRHHVKLGYPTLGTRRHNLRFVVGENIVSELTLENKGEDYASEILALGSGEGSRMIHAVAQTSKRDRLRRVRVVSDKSMQSKKRAMAVAEAELRLSQGVSQVVDVKVRDHANAVFGTWDVGDEIKIDSRSIPWVGEFSQWVRVVSQTWDVDRDEMTLTVQKVGAV